MKTSITKYCLGIILLILLSGSKSYAQRDFTTANQHYYNYEYELAIPYYKKSLAADTLLEEVERLADCYRLTHKYKEALKHYEQALNIPYYSSSSVYYYAEMLFKLGRYEEAELQYEFYKNYEPTNIEYINTCIESCKYARVQKSLPKKIKIENVKEINTKYNESSVFIGGKNIYFSSDRKYGSNIRIDSWTGNPFYKIYSIAYLNKNDKISFQRAKPFDVNINNGYHVYMPTFNSQENKLYYTSTELESNPRKKYGLSQKEFTNRMNITNAELVGKRWQKGNGIKASEEFNYSILHPCINKADTRLYFSSDMPGGYGSFDLYYCEIDIDGNLSKPINMGPSINTSGMEVYPSFANDSLLYYSSNGKIGFGGLDIFKATIENNNIKNIENLGFPINSSFDDFSFVPMLENRKGFFCSNREGGKGNDDIYIIYDAE